MQGAKDSPEYELACRIIRHCADAQENRKSKGRIMQEMQSLESEYDHRLVRGLFSLLERRSVFEQSVLANSVATPIQARKRLFEESSRQGLALSGSQRQEIMQKVSRQMHITAGDIERLMWADMDENLVMVQFDTIHPRDLIYWYNIALFQTLLFRCTRLEFYVKGGIHWKRILRNVKRQGLMYSLENWQDGSQDGKIRCVLEGPTSLFRMTERYGAAIARLLPSITETPTWEIRGTVTRSTHDGQKSYAFELSSESTQGTLRPMQDTTRCGKGERPDDNGTYDSHIEEDFAGVFCQRFDQNDSLGWKIHREPDPLVADGKAMIPDFVFERFGRKVYFEIVGFWTKEYLERKAAKLKALFGQNKNINLLVAVNSELSCSQIESISSKMVFTFKKSIPMKPILEHLKEIDVEITREKSGITQIKMDGRDMNVISVKEIAHEHAIPENVAQEIINSTYPDSYITVGSHMISAKKGDEACRLLRKTGGFVEACRIMASLGIPDVCHAELLSRLGYDVTWQDLNPDNATVIKR